MSFVRRARAKLGHTHLGSVGYVARPKPEIFDITKRKFHNVLQGIASPDVRLTEEEKQAFLDWSDENVHRYWKSENGGPSQIQT